MLRQFQNRKDYSQSVNLGREKFLYVLTLHFKSSRKKALAHLKISWELVTQRYARHLRFIFGISAIYLEAAHKQNSSCPGSPCITLGIHQRASVSHAEGSNRYGPVILL